MAVGAPQGRAGRTVEGQDEGLAALGRDADVHGAVRTDDRPALGADDVHAVVAQRRDPRRCAGRSAAAASKASGVVLGRDDDAPPPVEGALGAGPEW
jgi:hypothetical protein